MDTLVGIIVVGLIVYFLFFRKKGGGSSSSDSYSSSYDSSYDSSSSSGDGYSAKEVDYSTVCRMIRNNCFSSVYVGNFSTRDAKMSGSGSFDSPDDITLDFEGYACTPSFAGYDMQGAFENEIRKRINNLKRDLRSEYPSQSFHITWNLNIDEQDYHLV